jgi:hypothetical protein
VPGVSQRPSSPTALPKSRCRLSPDQPPPDQSRCGRIHARMLPRVAGLTPITWPRGSAST